MRYINLLLTLTLALTLTTVSECWLIKLLPYILFEKYIYILALETASPRNQHCVDCIGTLSFAVVRI